MEAIYEYEYMSMFKTENLGSTPFLFVLLHTQD